MKTFKLMLVVLILVMASVSLAQYGFRAPFFGDAPSIGGAQANAIQAAVNRGFPFRVSPWECGSMWDPYLGNYVRCSAIFSN